MITGERSFMRIAIDYDGTWDRDPEAFLAVALAFRDAGHEVVMVTVRSERRPGSPLPSVPPWITVYATGLAPKRAHMEELGIEVDIWIDDQPEWIVGKGGG
jgi:hypothetical protein